MKFTNNYNVKPAKASIPAEKELVIPDGLTGPAEWEFTITAAPQDDAPVASKMSDTVNKSKTSVSFGDIEYTKPGTYKYTLTESGSVKGVTNDPKSYE